MFYTEEISIERAAELLARCELKIPQGVDYTAGIFDDSGRLLASGSLKGDMIQGVCVEPERQGEDLTGKVFTALIGKAKEKGMSSLCLYTKPDTAFQFEGLGFRTVVSVRPYAALMEWGSGGIGEYQERLAEVRMETEKRLLSGKSSEREKTAAIVMNGNPFTLGHRWLCEQASAEADIVYVLVVEEDGSMFSFADRLAMAKEGTADLKNVVVLGGGRYAVSLLTFPSYFTGDEKAAEAHTAVDAAVFMRYIAPALGVGVRYLGSEPFSPVTAIYNKTLKEALPSAGIEVRQLKRLEHEGAPISASRVRRLLSQEGGFAEDEMRLLVPETTMKYLRQRFESEKHLTLAELLDSRENRADHQKELLKKYGGTLISMTLNIPGPVKDRPEYRRALREGMRQMKSALGQKIVYEEIRELITGPEGYLCTEMDGLEVKEKAVRVEEGSALGRLLDIDVLTAAGDDVQNISRSALGRPPRRCLLCGEDARVCARSRRHSMEELLEKIKEITGCFSL